jgi:hypothetical protein
MSFSLCSIEYNPTLDPRTLLLVLRMLEELPETVRNLKCSIIVIGLIILSKPRMRADCFFWYMFDYLIFTHFFFLEIYASRTKRRHIRYWLWKIKEFLGIIINEVLLTILRESFSLTLCTTSYLSRWRREL